MQEKILLAIVPGGQRLGYAVFRGSGLVFYGLTSLTHLNTNKKIFKSLKLFLNKTIGRFQVDFVVVRELTKPQRNSDLTPKVAKKIQSISRKKELKIFWLNRTIVNQAFCEASQRPTNERTEDFLSKIFPELQRYRSQNSIWQKKYYEPLFQAIALGLYFSNEKMRADNSKR